MKQRDESLDILKGMLVCGMIFSHVSGLTSTYNSFPMKQIWLFTGLSTFSGLLFSFGYVCQLAYFRKDVHIAARKMLITALKPLIAFYVSGIYWRAFIDKQISGSVIANILILNDIPPFSEFLIAYSLLMLVSLALFVPIQKLVASPKVFWVVFTLLLFTTFFPYHLIQNSQLALLVGTDRFPTYPVIQYSPIYLLGIYFAKHQIYRHRGVAIASTIGLAGFMVFYFLKGYTPSRFPPSFLWIVASLFFSYGYFLIARKIVLWRFAAEPLAKLGRNVLFYLLISNLAIFTFRGIYEKAETSPLASVGVTALLLVAIDFLINIVAVPQKVDASRG